jgi:DNA polymerase-4
VKDIKRTIDFINISSFMIEIERINNHELRNRPVVVAPLKSDSAKIWDVSLEAEQNGVHRGMELAVARKIYRGLEVVNPNPDLYESLQRKLLFKASRLTPLYEGEKLGQIYLDFTGFNKLYGNPLDFGQKLKRSIEHEFNLKPRLGIASNKLVSKAATNLHFVDGDIHQVLETTVDNFLDPFPNTVLPVVKDIKKQSKNYRFDIFEDLNLSTVLDLKKLDLVTLGAVFPSVFHHIHEMSRGIDFRVVSPPLSEPTVALDLHLEETNSRSDILNTLYTLADKAYGHLREQNKSSSEFKLAIRYSDFKYLEKTVNLRAPIKYSHEMYEELKRSFNFLFARRTTVRYLLLELRQLEHEQVQLDLFSESSSCKSELTKKLFNAMDDINKKFPDKVNLGRITQG